jgi:hypothetical protein
VIVDLPERMHRADRRTRSLVAWAGGIGLCVVFIAAAIFVANGAGERGHGVARAPEAAVIQEPPSGADPPPG